MIRRNPIDTIADIICSNVIIADIILVVCSFGSMVGAVRFIKYHTLSSVLVAGVCTYIVLKVFKHTSAAKEHDED